MYEIKIEYETGNSFERWDDEDTVGYVWEDIEDAREALRRIKGHYEWYRNTTHLRLRDDDKPEKPEYVVNKYSLLIPSNGNKNDFKISAFWCGYFERLKSAHIELYKKDMEEYIP